MTILPSPPLLLPLAQVRCEVSPLVSLGPAKRGERRYIPLLGGTVTGPEVCGRIVEGGVDWQVRRTDGVLDIAADEYFFRTIMRFTTGAPAWLHLNKVLALAVGQRDVGAVLLDVYRIT